MDKQQGTVKWFNDKIGFGFLLNENGEDVFVHHRSIEPEKEGWKTLQEGQEVDFYQTKTARGWSASEVKVVDTEELV